MPVVSGHDVTVRPCSLTSGDLLGTPSSESYGPAKGNGGPTQTALIRFLDGKQRGRTATVADAVVHTEGRYRFKKRDITKKGGRAYYLKAVPRKRFASGSPDRPHSSLSPRCASSGKTPCGPGAPQPVAH
jgi:hypothetical protein